MFFINENKEIWYKRLNMYPKSYTCSGCGKDVIVGTPFISKDIYGLCSDICCKEEFRIFRAKPKSAELQRQLNDAFQLL